ncbi:phage protein NinX family protein [Yersinia enterocolitica]|uniref:phage protein NinX family protein n=1 Tax=Yersinia enterocolitica TaxID=630 RepID=UPI000D9DFD4D|nr:phage protein NinX family protein [Yersinia enterocolitica]SQA40424.1 Protein of uncharacterised function (DUF2591) [Yersinia enterocolitica]SUP65414.1 Protein of uncharacterised function (DUF2591) [Yersinia enterocolitica]HDM8272767.1 DUF2591 family protein [Yersinia enterocolitica]HED5565373.1 DUF2591 family protein [Yersinia enterocolitica]
MKDYSAMSDFESNKAVADIVMNGTWHLEPSHPNNTTGGWLYGSNGIQTYSMPDYCNNPADAWPIMFEHGIGIDYDGISWTASDWRENKHSDWRNHPERPLRLAMIVFLMMAEGNADAE